ncbi:DMT family transporter [Novispirillum itersonii]|uniref:DMT family transporter n=1 Tax=Novispirillum itersonii TaxID=189 RepID=UPI00035C20CA|nr:DMT family transporter [Novispirillum itersonii]
MSRLQAHALLLIAAMIWGSTFVVQKLAVAPDTSGGESIGALAFTGVRFLMGALVVLPLALREARAASQSLTRADWLGFLGCGVSLFAGAWLQQVGLGMTTVTNAGFITGLYVPMVPVIALLLFRRTPHWAVWPGAAGCAAGIFLLGGGHIDAFNTGDAWVLAGAVFWAIQVTFVGIFASRSGRPLALAVSQFVIAGVLGSIAAGLLETPRLELFEKAAFELAWAGFLSVGVAFTLQVIGQRYTHPATAAILLSSEMAFAALAGAVALGETMGLIQAVGGALILGSIILVEVMPTLQRRPLKAAE